MIATSWADGGITLVGVCTVIQIALLIDRWYKR